MPPALVLEVSYSPVRVIDPASGKVLRVITTDQLRARRMPEIWDAEQLPQHQTRPNKRNAAARAKWRLAEAEIEAMEVRG